MRNPDVAKKVGLAIKGQKRSEETKKKIGLALKGRPWSEARREAQKTVVRGQGRVAKLKALKEK